MKVEAHDSRGRRGTLATPKEPSQRARHRCGGSSKPHRRPPFLTCSDASPGTTAWPSGLGARRRDAATACTGSFGCKAARHRRSCGIQATTAGSATRSGRFEEEVMGLALGLANIGQHFDPRSDAIFPRKRDALPRRDWPILTNRDSRAAIQTSGRGIWRTMLPVVALVPSNNLSGHISNNLAGRTSLGHRPSEWNHPRGLGTIRSRSSQRPGRDKPARPEQLPPPAATDAGRSKAAQMKTQMHFQH